MRCTSGSWGKPEVAHRANSQPPAPASPLEGDAPPDWCQVLQAAERPERSFPDGYYTWVRERPMETIRVIIADDHAVVREGTRSILEQSRGIRVVGEAADGREAVRLVGRLRPDVAIIDVAMPVMNGIEATRAIKAQYPSTGVLVLTAYDDDPYIFALLEAGAAGYLMKDVSAVELAEAVRKVRSGEAVLHSAVARKVLHRFVGGNAEDRTRPPLSEREIQVLQHAAQGKTNKEIARALGLSARTVQAHLHHAFRKLDVASRTEAIVCGLRQGWLRLEDVG